MIQAPTIEQINTIIGDPRFKSIPGLTLPANTPWYDLTRQASDAGLDTFTWELAHRIALVFDTYGPAIHEVGISWQTSTEDGEVLLVQSTLVNGSEAEVSYRPHPTHQNGTNGTWVIEVGINEELTDLVKGLDQGAALQGAYETAEDAPSPLAGNIRELRERFSSITSAQQAREIAASISPAVLARIHAIASQMGLDASTSPALPAARPSPRV